MDGALRDGSIGSVVEVAIFEAIARIFLGFSQGWQSSLPFRKEAGVGCGSKVELAVSFVEVGDGFGDSSDLAYGMPLVQVLLTLFKNKMQYS